MTGANCHDSPLLGPTLGTALEPLGPLPDAVTVHLDRGYHSGTTRDLLTERGLHGHIAERDKPAHVQVGARWVVERTNSWHNRGFNKLAICTERHTRVVGAFIALANAIITLRRLLRRAWTTRRWDARPNRKP